jgi:hypothetical protein
VETLGLLFVVFIWGASLFTPLLVVVTVIAITGWRRSAARGRPIAALEKAERDERDRAFPVPDR